MVDPTQAMSTETTGTVLTAPAGKPEAGALPTRAPQPGSAAVPTPASPADRCVYVVIRSTQERYVVHKDAGLPIGNPTEPAELNESGQVA